MSEHYTFNKYSLGIILSVLTAVVGFIGRFIPFNYNGLQFTLDQVSSICSVPLVNLAPICETVVWVNYFSWFMVMIGLFSFVYFVHKRMG